MIASHPGKYVLVVLCWLFCGEITSGQDEVVPSRDCPAIERRLPPLGEAPAADQIEDWQKKIYEVSKRMAGLPDAAEKYSPDVAVLIKACRLAIEHQEFYRDRDFAKVDRLLKLASDRVAELESASGESKQPTWQRMEGLQVRGFTSNVDGSTQPLGLVFPEGLDITDSNADAKVPLYVWLHGRGDKMTELHFICERLDKRGQIAPQGSIVVHPFGRQCVGYKSAGETDVMEAIRFVCDNYPIDEDRIVLMGFSMGGAGVWHLAAHYGERFVAASPGAGFAETARYQRLTPDRYPPKYEQLLWQVYDVPGYVRNLFNLPVIAYSGENDKQIQAARVMEEAFEQQGRTLPHLIGPGMGHKYHPDTLEELLSRMHEYVVQGRSKAPQDFFIQSPHPRYASREWLTIDGMKEPYADTRVDAHWLKGPSTESESVENQTNEGRSRQGQWKLTTLNVSRLTIDTDRDNAPREVITLDGQAIQLPSNVGGPIHLESNSGKWLIVDSFQAIRKRPGLSGPIDDAFVDSFMVVTPTGKSAGNTRVDEWVACELEFFQRRWRSLMRGELRVKRDSEVTESDIRQHHLILWGTPESNSLLGRFLDQSTIPLRWTDREVRIGTKALDASQHIPQAIYPNSENPDRYVVLNSGLTFRPAHDRTNSLQNPHLPDWAVISLDEAPSAERPGRVVQAGFFDDRWQLDPKWTW